jgi:hypothetical protein
VDLEADLAAMKYQGGNASINETLKRVVPGMFWKGHHPNEILARVSAETAACGARAGQAWDEANREGYLGAHYIMLQQSSNEEF